MKPLSMSVDRLDNDNDVSHTTSPREQDTLPLLGSAGSFVRGQAIKNLRCRRFLQSLMKCRFLFAAELAHLSQLALKSLSIHGGQTS